MNINFVEIIKRIIAEQGEDILADAQRVKGLVQDYAARESKIERLAFGRCIEYGAYTELKNAEGAVVRQAVKAAVAQKVHSNEGMDIALCNDALDVLEAAVFGVASTPPQYQAPQTPQQILPHETVSTSPEEWGAPAQAATISARVTPSDPVKKKHTKRDLLIAAGVVIVVVGVILGIHQYRITQAEAHYQRGEEYYSVDDYDNAIYEYTQAIGFDSHRAELYIGRGDAYFYKDDYHYDQAIQDYNKAIELDSQYAYAYHSRGSVYYIQNYYDLAIQDFNKAIELYPQYAYAYASRGDVYRARGDNVRAINDYEKALQIDPSLTWVKDSLAEAKGYKIGDRGPAGGWIFYDKGTFSDGWRYLEAAPVEAEFVAFWRDDSYFAGYYVSGTSTALGTGKRNTQIIEDFFRGKGGSTAAQMANNLIWGFRTCSGKAQKSIR
jgi:tetratricopeptide (TPR) repeat protein